MVYLQHALLSTQITAVKIKDDYVFIGEGQNLHVHCLSNGEIITGVHVFRAAVIHGIQINVDKQDCDGIWNILVWGQKNFAALSFKSSEKLCWLTTREKSHDDWIVDASWEMDMAHVVLATAHNVLLRCRIPEQQVDSHGEDTTISSGQHQLEECNIISREQCVENCILYCGCIVLNSGSWCDVVLLAGTVFSEILLWGPWGKKNHLGRIIPSHRLSGHQGVLFSIRYCPVKSVITSTSDDRSLRVWSIHKPSCDVSVCDLQRCTDDHQNEVDNCDNILKECQVVEKFKCYGHGARVWRSLILPSCYVSVGEDSRVCVWDNAGVLVTSWRAHDGSCVWSVSAADKGDVIVTGGGDGSVKSWCLNLNAIDKVELMINLPYRNDTMNSNSDHSVHNISIKRTHEPYTKNKMALEGNFECDSDSSNDSTDVLFKNKDSTLTITSSEKTTLTPPKAADFPRCVSLLGQNTCLVMMNSGTLYSWDFKSSTWTIVIMDERFKNYAVMESSPDKNLIALGTLCGNIIIIGRDSSDKCLKVISEEKALPGKVFSVLWLGNLNLITCGSEGNMVSWTVHLEAGKIEQGYAYVLPVCKQRWVSAACVFEPLDISWLICGDRAGGIHLYSENSSESRHSLRGIHGRNGVTSVSHHKDYLYSTGRDGSVRCLTVHNDCLQVLTVTRVSNVNWVAALIYLYEKPVAVCFHDVMLKLWSLEEDRALVEIECGGGHRSWALQVSEEENELTGIYIKDTVPYTFRTTLKDKLMPLIKTPVNTRETMCLEVLFQFDDTTVFATGGEDTTLRLHSLKGEKLNTSNVIRSHISNIRAMCRIDDEEGYFQKDHAVWIVSAGGRAQFKIWKAVLHPMSDDVQPFYVSCREVASHMLRTGSSKTWKSQEITFDPETRYMDASAFWMSKTQAVIILASSDGFIRIFEFNSPKENIRILCSQAWNFCLLKVMVVHICQQSILVSAATDGYLVFWNMKPVLESIRENDDDEAPCELEQLARIKAHQSGINSIAVVPRDINRVDKPYCFTLASGGDDNKLWIWDVTVPFSETNIFSVNVEHGCEAVGHASQITGLTWVDGIHLISTSIDQRVVVWKIQQSCICVSLGTSENLTSSHKCNNTLIDISEGRRRDEKAGNTSACLKVASSYFTGVPDIKGVSVSNISQHSLVKGSAAIKQIFIYGVGLHVFDVKDNIS